MQHLKIFNVEKLGEALIVTPVGEGSAFRYQDLHLETNAVRGYLSQPDVRLLVLDLKMIDYFGSEFIGALVSMLREMRTRGRKACFCNGNEQVQQILKNMSLFKLWPLYASREEALSELTAVSNTKSN